MSATKLRKTLRDLRSLANKVDIENVGTIYDSIETNILALEDTLTETQLEIDAFKTLVVTFASMRRNQGNLHAFVERAEAVEPKDRRMELSMLSDHVKNSVVGFLEAIRVLEIIGARGDAGSGVRG